LHEYQKYAEFYAAFKSVEIVGKKRTLKVICQELLQVSSIEEDKLQLAHYVCLTITFLLAYFSHFSQQFQNQRKILRCFDTHIQICMKQRFLGHISTYKKL
jgi:hypothetical protein